MMARNLSLLKDTEVMVIVEAPGQFVEDVVGLEVIVEEAVDVELIAVEDVVVVVFVLLGGNRQEHPLESLDDEDEHADAKAEIEGVGITGPAVYVWQKAEALLMLPSSAR